MSLSLGLDPEVANTVIVCVATVVSGVLGGLVGALATLKATKQALAHSTATEETKRNEILRGVLLGIRTELEVLFETYQAEMRKTLDEFKDGQAIYLTLPIYHNVFTVYESNCSLIGQVADDDLRRSIIRVYMLAKSLVNAHTYNNRLIEEYERIGLASPASAAHKRAYEEMQHYGVQIVATYKEVFRAFTDTVQRINDSEVTNQRVHLISD